MQKPEVEILKMLFAHQLFIIAWKIFKCNKTFKKFYFVSTNLIINIKSGSIDAYILPILSDF